jgi:predicted dienelactone hydrolase
MAIGSDPLERTTSGNTGAMNLRSRIACIVVASLIAAACSSGSDTASDAEAATTTAAPETTAAATETTEAPTTTTTVATTTTPAPPPELELIGPGPYEVGVATIEIANAANERPLTVDVWMPLADGTTGEPHQYTLLPGSYYESPDAITADPSSLSADGPFPLVVYSHGSGGIRYIHASYTEALASHGYVVVAPDHTGNTATDALLGSATEPEVTAWNRVNDVTAVLDAMLDPANTVTAPFSSAIDAEQVGVTGHSFGGFTAHALASGFTTEFGSLDADPRVDAIVSLAPFTRPILTDEQLSSISIPSMMIAGTNDVTTPTDPNVDDPWELIVSEQAVRVELLDAEHETFTDVCNMLDFLPQVETVAAFVVDALSARTEAGCDPEDMPIDRAETLTQTFAVNFFDTMLKGGDAIDPAAVTVPDDVVVETRGI